MQEINLLTEFTRKAGTKIEPKNIKIDDTTLRDGEQTAGVVFANDEKIHIAKMLDKIGVHQIEAGIPTMGGDEKEAIKKIASLGLSCSILGWNRAVKSDVDASLECGVDAVAISISSSDIHIEHKLMKSREWVLESMSSTVNYAKKYNLYVSVNAEDASRSDMEFLLQFARTAKEAGADRLRYCDTLGILDPFETFMRVKTIIDIVRIDIEMHTHNDFGMAIANAIAGIKAGAAYVNTTVNGLGERAGNASFEELVMALKYIEEIDMGFNTKLFRELSEYVANASARFIPTWKPIVGANLFVYESENRAHAITVDPSTYELFKPEDVGLERKIIIGKYSGISALKSKLNSLGYKIKNEEAKEISEITRNKSVALKRSLYDSEIIDVYKSYKGESSKKKLNKNKSGKRVSAAKAKGGK
ncbi:MAG: homocitrate synthase [Actinobacteria bacterium]|nr:homocitrate synthase [Actinomycetota bacterium]MBL7060564.1 homocitrate synthase [Actinomycetota bacterium]